MAKEDKIIDINQQITKLQARRKRLEDKRRAQISTIMLRCGATALPDDVLAGVIVEAVRAYAANYQRLSTWKNEGKKIIHPGRGRRKANA